MVDERAHLCIGRIIDPASGLILEQVAHLSSLDNTHPQQHPIGNYVPSTLSVLGFCYPPANVNTIYYAHSMKRTHLALVIAWNSETRLSLGVLERL